MTGYEDGRTVQCPICKEPYTVHRYTVRDQSACPSCIRKAREKDRSPKVMGGGFRNEKI